MEGMNAAVDVRRVITRGRGYRLWVTAILFLLPFLVILRIRDQIFLNTWQEARIANLEHLNQVVSHFSRLAEPISFYQESLQRLKRAFIWEEDSTTKLATLPPGNVDCYVFDGNGKRRTQSGFATGLVNVSERCLKFIRDAAQGKLGRLTDKDRKLADSFFGNANAIELLARNPGQLQNLEGLSLRRLAGVFPFRDRERKPGFLVVFIDNPPTLRFELGGLAMRKMQKLAGPGIGFGLVDLQNQFPSEVTGTASLTRPLLALLESSGEVRCGQKVWVRNILDNRYLLFGVCREPATPTAFLHRQRILLLAGGVGFLFLLLLQETLVRRGVPIRVQVASLFSLAGMASILALLVLANEYLEIRQKTLLRERFVQTREVLEKIDSSFPFYQDRLIRMYRRLGADFAAQMRKTGTIRETPKEGVRWPRNVALMVFGEQGNLLFQHSAKANPALTGMLGQNFLETVGETVGMAVKTYNLTARQSHDHDVFIEDSKAHIGRMSKKLFLHCGGFFDITVGWATLPLYFDFLLGDDGLAKGALWISSEANLIERSYLALACKRLHNYDFLNRYPIRLIPLGPSGFHGQKNRSLPWNAIHDLSQVVARRKMPGYQQATMGQNSLMLTGLPGRNLASFNLVLVSSLQNLEREARTLARGFLGFSLLILCFALALSYVFARLLLDPISQLTNGLLCLSRSQFSTQICIQTGDELQVVGEGINTIFEEMRELALARNIQTHLLPSGPLSSKSWECQGWSRSPSEIGGEIYDYWELPDNRIFLWVAGMPGHSIGSALILAMTKMAIRALVELKHTEPVALLEEIQRTLFSPIGKNAPGSLLLGILDIPSGTLDLSWQAPFLLGKTTGTGSVDLLHFEMPGGKMAQKLSLQTVLGPGDCLFILSGGCWARDRAAEETRIALQAWLTARVHSPTDDPITLFADLDLHRPNSNDQVQESQTILKVQHR